MATSKLQEYTAKRLFNKLPHLSIKENHRPEWLQSHNGNRLELDFFIEELSIAIEVQGIQHCQFTPFFHNGYEDFEKQLKHDEIKRTTCSIENIELYEVASRFDVDILIKEVLSQIKPQTTILYQRQNFFRNKSKVITEQYNKGIRRLKKKIRQSEKIKTNVGDIEKAIDYHNYLIASRQGMAEHNEYKKYLRQIRGRLKVKRNNLLIGQQRIATYKDKLQKAEIAKEKELDKIPKWWEKYYNEAISNLQY